MSVIETHAVPMSLLKEWAEDPMAQANSCAAWALRNDVEVVFVIDTEHPDEKPLAIIHDSAA